jgi:glucose-1-phosphate thymidylyltransferase
MDKMKAVILAAGYATRLYPLTLDKPKCLLIVDGQTILDTIVDKLNAVQELDEIVIVTNAKFFAQLEEWKKKSKSRLPVRVLSDGTTSNDNRLGAIGDLKFSIRECHIDTDVLMMASDNLFEEALTGFIRFARSRKEHVTVALYDIKDKSLASKKFGVLEMNQDSEITGIEEKPEQPKSSLIGMGVYYFPKDSLKRVEEYLSRRDANDAPGYYVRWLLKRVKIFGFLFSGLWYDIGNLQALEDANRTFKVPQSRTDKGK